MKYVLDLLVLLFRNFPSKTKRGPFFNETRSQYVYDYYKPIITNEPQLIGSGYFCLTVF